VTVHCAAQLLESAQNAWPTHCRSRGEGAHREPLHRRRLRRQAAGVWRRDALGHGRAAAAAAGEDGAHAPADVPRHHAPQRHGAARAAGRHARWQAHWRSAHESLSHSARFDDFYETASTQTRSLYAAPNRLTTHRVVKLDLPISDSTRAPGEAVGMLALEQAMDELAEKLGWTRSSCGAATSRSDGPGEEHPLLHPPAGALHGRRRRALRLEPGAAPKPGAVREGRWLDRHGHGGRHAQQLPHGREVRGGARSARACSRRACR
jgi:xanthine dehydrogenase YagR molybdenum-binding subunit